MSLHYVLAIVLLIIFAETSQVLSWRKRLLPAVSTVTRHPAKEWKSFPCSLEGTRAYSRCQQPLQASIRVDSDAFSDQFTRVSSFLLKAGLVGTFTGMSVVIFKTVITKCSQLFYEDLANILPKPSFYWPLALFPLIGSAGVSLLVHWRGDAIRKGIDSIARSIDAKDGVVFAMPFFDPVFLHPSVSYAGDTTRRPWSMNDIAESSVIVLEDSSPGNPASIETPVGLAPNLPFPAAEALSANPTDFPNPILSQPIANLSSATICTINLAGNASWPEKGAIPFNPFDQFVRLAGAVATLGSGCSLGPEGPAVEIGAGWSRIFSGLQSSQQERHHLFLAGTAAGVAAGFNAPIAGVFFAIECGNRYLRKNTVKLDENAPDGPRADIAAIVTAAALADIVVGIGLRETGALSIQGNSYAMSSPFFELPLYMGLGLACGAIAAIFTGLRDAFTEIFTGMTWGKHLPFAALPKPLHPIFGGLVCGVVAVLWPQTLFVGYATLDQLMAGKIQLGLPLVLQLLGLKIFLSAFSLGSGLIGGVFAPSLFFGAAAGTAYHDIVSALIQGLNEWALDHHLVTSSIAKAIQDGTSIMAMPSNSGEIAVLPTDLSFFTLANAPAYATVGAAATLGALFRAPLTSSMLMFELTQNHDIVLPVLVSTGLGGLFAEILSKSRKLW
eukprot:gene5883-6478_t